MLWSVVMHLVGLIVDLLSGARGEAEEKDLQIALLRHQVRLLQRRLPRPRPLSRWEKLPRGPHRRRCGRVHRHFLPEPLAVGVGSGRVRGEARLAA